MDMIKHFLQWIAAFFEGTLRLILDFAKRHPIVAFFFILFSLANPVLGLALLALYVILH